MSATPPAGPATANEPPPRRSSRANLLVIGLASALVLATAGVLMHALTTRSRDAVVDGDFIELTSPINGQLRLAEVEAGTAVRSGEVLAHVEDPRASDVDVRNLRTALTTAEAQRDQVTTELALQKRLAGDFARDAGTQRRLETARSSNDLAQLRASRSREQQEDVGRAAIALVLFPRWLFLGRNVRHARTITWVVSQKHRCLREFRSPLRSPLSLLAPP